MLVVLGSCGTSMSEERVRSFRVRQLCMRACADCASCTSASGCNRNRVAIWNIPHGAFKSEIEELHARAQDAEVVQIISVCELVRILPQGRVKRKGGLVACHVLFKHLNICVCFST